MRRPSSVPSEDYYTKSRMTNARTRSRSASIQGENTPLTLASIITSNRSLFILSERNIIRRFCKKIVESKVSFWKPISFDSTSIEHDSWRWLCFQSIFIHNITPLVTGYMFFFVHLDSIFSVLFLFSTRKREQNFPTL